MTPRNNEQRFWHIDDARNQIMSEKYERNEDEIFDAAVWGELLWNRTIVQWRP